MEEVREGPEEGTDVGHLVLFLFHVCDLGLECSQLGK